MTKMTNTNTQRTSVSFCPRILRMRVVSAYSKASVIEVGTVLRHMRWGSVCAHTLCIYISHTRIRTCIDAQNVRGMSQRFLAFAAHSATATLTRCIHGWAENVNARHRVCCVCFSFVCVCVCVCVMQLPGNMTEVLLVFVIVVVVVGTSCFFFFRL